MKNKGLRGANLENKGFGGANLIKKPLLTQKRSKKGFIKVFPALRQALTNSIVLTSLGGVAAVALSVAAAAAIPIRLRVRVALPVLMHPNPTRTSKYMQVNYKHLNMDECDSECLWS